MTNPAPPGEPANDDPVMILAVVREILGLPDRDPLRIAACDTWTDECVTGLVACIEAQKAAWDDLNARLDSETARADQASKHLAETDDLFRSSVHQNAETDKQVLELQILLDTAESANAALRQRVAELEKSITMHIEIGEAKFASDATPKGGK